MQHIVVHGAGAIGCFIGGMWARAGLKVTLLGRPALIVATRSGMHLTDYDGFNAHIPAHMITVTDDAACLRGADLIALTVKCTALEAAALEINTHATAGVPVISFQNGVTSGAQLGAHLAQNPMIDGMVPFNVARIVDNHWHKGTKGTLMCEPHASLAPILAAAAATPAALKPVADMPPVLWGKLLLNLNNAINALSGLTLKAELSDRRYRRIVAASIREALVLLDAAGIKPARITPLPPHWLPGFLSMPDAIFNRIGLKMQKIDDKAQSSMANDFDAGRMSEIDYLNGEIVTLAETLGRPAPINARIMELVRAADAGDTKRWSAEELTKAILP